MKSLLNAQYDPETLQKDFENCCKQHPPCSGDLEKIAKGIEDLASLKPAQYVTKVAGMEHSLQQKCSELKAQRTFISQLLSQSTITTKDSSTHMDLSSSNASTQITFSSTNFGQQCDIAPKEILKEVEKIVEKVVEKIVEVEKIIERPVV